MLPRTRSTSFWGASGQVSEVLRHSDMHAGGCTVQCVELLLGLTGSIAVVLLIAWRIRRSQSDVDELDDAEYRPPPIGGQAGPH
jgi:hypothetical protein